VYKLAIVPKIKKRVEYTSAYGSHLDYTHIYKCLSIETFNKNIECKVLNETQFFKINKEFDGVLFIGTSSRAQEFISTNTNINIFAWGCFIHTANNTPESLNNVDIVFEQSTNKYDKNKFPNSKVVFLPTGFQDYSEQPIKKYNPKYDIVFNGTLYRNRREKTKKYRVEILEGLLKKGLSVLNINGRAKTDTERKLLEPLKKYSNFHLLPKFGTIKHYHFGKYSLDLPFLDTMTDNLEEYFGLSLPEIENGIWLNHWDIFRAIGAKANIITFDSPEVRNLGLNDENASFYKSSLDDISNLIEEISSIARKGNLKFIDYKVWSSNTYQSRWSQIITEIEEIINKN